MLPAIRRRRADAKASRAPRHCNLKLPTKTARELRSVARQAGITVAQLLNAFVARLQGDDSVLAQLRQHCVAPDFEQSRCASADYSARRLVAGEFIRPSQ